MDQGRSRSIAPGGTGWSGGGVRSLCIAAGLQGGVIGLEAMMSLFFLPVVNSA